MLISKNRLNLHCVATSVAFAGGRTAENDAGIWNPPDTPSSHQLTARVHQARGGERRASIKRKDEGESRVRSRGSRHHP